MNMRTFGALAISAFVLVGCSDADLVGFNTDCSNLLGTFTATSATITGTGTDAKTVNLLADSSKLDIAFGQGTYSFSYRTGPNADPSVASGTFTAFSPDHLTINGTKLYPNGSLSSSFTCSIDGTELTLEDAASSYTFAGAAEASPARVTIKATRGSL